MGGEGEEDEADEEEEGTRRARPVKMKPAPIHQEAASASPKSSRPRMPLAKKFVALLATVAASDEPLRSSDLTNKFHISMLHRKIIPKHIILQHSSAWWTMSWYAHGRSLLPLLVPNSSKCKSLSPPVATDSAARRLCIVLPSMASLPNTDARAAQVPAATARPKPFDCMLFGQLMERITIFAPHRLLILNNFKNIFKS